MDIRTAKWIVLLTAFISGALIDMMSSSAGLNAAVCTLLALVRYPIIKVTIPNNVIEDGGPILSSSVPFRKFVLYVSIMLLIWSVFFFFAESSFINPSVSLRNILFNVIVGTFIITFIQLPIKKSL